MSVREFGAHLGVSDRMVSKWEAGGEAIRPRPLNQAALDTSLAMAGPDIKKRFVHIVSGPNTRAARPRRAEGVGLRPLLPPTLALKDVVHLVRHPLDGKLMTMIDAAPYRSGSGMRWLEGYFIDVYPTTNADYLRFIGATDHHPPTHWPDGGYTITDDPTALHDDPVTGLSYDDAKAYAEWAAKDLPTTVEWDQAALCIEGMATTTVEVREWCRSTSGPALRGPELAIEGGFRCASPAPDLLALLAV
jgi:hypothetical protein